MEVVGEVETMAVGVEVAEGEEQAPWCVVAQAQHGVKKVEAACRTSRGVPNAGTEDSESDRGRRRHDGL